MDELWMLARRQLGLITWAQALQLVSEDRFRTLIERGHVERMRFGVWIAAGAQRTYEQTVLAAVLLGGDFAWASHRTAAKLAGLLVPPPDEVDVLTLPLRRIRADGVRHHRNKSIPTEDVGRIGCVPATSIPRTLVDCLPWLPGKAFGRAVDDARRRGLVTYEQVDRAHKQLDRGRRTGRHLVVPARPYLAKQHDPGGSDRELDILRILEDAGRPLPVQQYRVFVAGRWRHLDYAYPEQKVYLEWDGFGEHGEIREVFDDDRERDAELLLLGWHGLHFTSNTRPSDVVSRVERDLAQRAS
jgi:hypothetical protein